MKITEQQLRKLIREEIKRLNETWTDLEQETVGDKVFKIQKNVIGGSKTEYWVSQHNRGQSVKKRNSINFNDDRNAAFNAYERALKKGKLSRR